MSRLIGLTTAAACLTIIAAPSARAMFGMELGPLLQLVAGQVTEIERLSEQIGVTKENRKFLEDLNSGINRTVQQIQSIQAIVERAQGLEPKAIRSVAALNDYLRRVHDARRAVDEALGIRLQASELAVGQSSLQSETAYRMGQEMIASGGVLAKESQGASPGRAAQISAATGSAQMLADGVQLQTLAQMVQLQALQLELQRAQLEQLQLERRQSQSYFQNRLSQPPGSIRRAR